MVQASGGIPLGEWSASNATRELHQTIKEFSSQSTKQTETMIRLTWAILALTGVMVIAVGVQIWMALTTRG